MISDVEHPLMCLLAICIEDCKRFYEKIKNNKSTLEKMNSSDMDLERDMN